MSTENDDATVYPFTPSPPAPPSPPKLRKPRRSRLTKTAAGFAVVLGTGTGVAAVVLATSGGPTTLASASATSSTSGPASATTTPARTPRFRRGFPGGPALSGPGAFGRVAGMGLNGVLHGSYTVKGPGGSYETIGTQYGKAEAVTSTSITVKSADGFSQTYQVGSGTVVDAGYNGILSVAVGDDVSIQGLVNGSGVTAERVTDITQVQANRQSWAPGVPNPPNTTLGGASSTPTGPLDDGPGPAAA